MSNFSGYNETKSSNALADSLNKKITALSLDVDVLRFVFEDGSKMNLFDGGHQCCETRYMTTDDKLSYFIGAKLLDVEVMPAEPIWSADENHEVAFLDVKTDKGTFQMATHNIHNGYYGGFDLRAELEG